MGLGKILDAFFIFLAILCLGGSYSAVAEQGGGVSRVGGKLYL